MKRSASFDVDADFDVYCDVTKATTLPNGKRLIRGVASGVLEDRDGERVSARAIAQMAAQPIKGMKLVAETAGHAQNWTNEIGEIVSLNVDPETGELIAEAELPPEGKDPLADKAWERLNSPRSPLGYSIGGKLRKAYYEIVGEGAGVKKRKVLDGIGLRHILLTDRPSYAPSVVEAIAKCAKSFVAEDSLEFADVDPGDELRDAIAIAKAAKPEPEDAPDQGAADAAAGPADGEAPPDDSAAAPAAGTADTSQPGAPAAAAGAADPAAAPSDAQAAQGLPLSNRHLSCPNCGEEFAAPLPDEGADASSTATEPPPPAVGKTTTPKETQKMDDLKAVLAEIDALKQRVEKTTAAADEAPVEPGDLTDVERMLATVHKTATERADAAEAAITAGFELVGKSFQQLADRVASMPQGRRSSAAFAPGKPNVDVEVAKTKTDDDVQKTAEGQAESGDLLGALKTLNARTYGVK